MLPYVKDDRAHMTYNFLGENRTTITTTELPAEGGLELKVRPCAWYQKKTRLVNINGYVTKWSDVRRAI